MPNPLGWDATEAIGNLSFQAWHGDAWRLHGREYEATDHGGSALYSGRYHRALDMFPAAETWPALYLSLAAEISVSEMIRHLPLHMLIRLNRLRLSQLAVSLSRVLDCRSGASLGLDENTLIQDFDYSTTQAISAAAISRGAEAILVPSATALGDNLVVFPNRLETSSRIAVIGSRDPRLFVPR